MFIVINCTTLLVGSIEALNNLYTLMYYICAVKQNYVFCIIHNIYTEGSINTGCSLSIVFIFEDVKIYSRLRFHQCLYWPFTAFPRCQCVYTKLHARTARWQVDH